MPMPNKLPKFLDNHKICIICEGNEEYEYLNRLKNLKVWNEQYDISLVNAGGMVISRRGIRTDIKMEQMNLYLYFVIQRRSLTSSMRTLNAKLMNFMVWIVQRMK